MSQRGLGSHRPHGTSAGLNPRAQDFEPLTSNREGVKNPSGRGQDPGHGEALNAKDLCDGRRAFACETLCLDQPQYQPYEISCAVNNEESKTLVENFNVS